MEPSFISNAITPRYTSLSIMKSNANYCLPSFAISYAHYQRLTHKFFLPWFCKMAFHGFQVLALQMSLPCHIMDSIAVLLASHFLDSIIRVVVLIVSVHISSSCTNDDCIVCLAKQCGIFQRY